MMGPARFAVGLAAVCRRAEVSQGTPHTVDGRRVTVEISLSTMPPAANTDYPSFSDVATVRRDVMQRLPFASRFTRPPVAVR